MMTKKSIAFIAVLVSLAAAWCQTASAQTARGDKAEQALGELVREYAEAVRRGDADALDRLLAEDYEEVSLFGEVDAKAKVVGAYRDHTANPGGPGELDSIDVDEVKARVYGDTAVVTVRETFKGKTNGQPFSRALRLTYVCKKERGRWRFVASHAGGIRPTPNLSTFEILPAPEKIKNLNWVKLAEDKQGDGRLKESADGKAFYYFYDAAADALWFKFELYNAVSAEAPAVSVSLDTDADQATGVNWYGTNKAFKLDKMLSVGPTQKQGGKFLGYNGITDAKGITDRNWINDKKGVLTFYYDTEQNSYFIGVKRGDISPQLRKFNVIGSVGANSTWNDDIGEQGFATVEINQPR